MLAKEEILSGTHNRKTVTAPQQYKRKIKRAKKCKLNIETNYFMMRQIHFKMLNFKYLSIINI